MLSSRCVCANICPCMRANICQASAVSNVAFSQAMVSGDSSCKPCDSTQDCSDWLSPSVTSSGSLHPLLSPTHTPHPRPPPYPPASLPCLFIYLFIFSPFLHLSASSAECGRLGCSSSCSSSIHGLSSSLDRQLQPRPGPYPSSRFLSLAPCISGWISPGLLDRRRLGVSETHS